MEHKEALALRFLIGEATKKEDRNNKKWTESELAKLSAEERRSYLKKGIKKSGDKDDRLWDAIWKAHRDTVTGARTGNISKYCSKNAHGKKKTLKLLYEIIKEDTSALYTEKVFTALTAKMNDVTGEKAEKGVEFAAMQKLVNMTLKYIIILNLFEQKEIHKVCEEKCDCPIDSVILNELKRGRKDVGFSPKEYPSWTLVCQKEYDEIQEDIRECLKKKHPDKKGNIWFDFLMWEKP